MIDLHCHFLPGVDDGPETMDQALDLARAAVADGIQVSVLTSHVHPERYGNTRSSLQSSLTAFAGRLAEERIPLSIRLGGEARLAPELLDLLVDDELPFIGHVDGYRILLLEFPHQMIPVGSYQLIAKLIEHRIRPLIAHPERNKAIMAAPEKIRPYTEAGCWLQLTAASLAGNFGEPAEETAWAMVEAGHTSVVATDAHNLENRPPSLSAGRAAVHARYGKAFADNMVRTLPARIVGLAAPVLS
jgi:protein-tyrosine phosphatase